jgi:hypothetical protein
MNPYKLNSVAGQYFRKTICDAWRIPFTMIYKEVLDINKEGYIFRKDGKVYKLTLTEVINDAQRSTTS